MKKIIMLGMVLVIMFVSLGGCYWGYPGRDRGVGHDRNRSDGQHDHDRDGRHDERR